MQCGSPCLSTDFTLLVPFSQPDDIIVPQEGAPNLLTLSFMVVWRNYDGSKSKDF